MEESHPQDVAAVRTAFRVGYLGGGFFGSQVQAKDRTVEGEFIAACIRTELFSDPREAKFLAAGRTDRGVHARSQVFSFVTPYPDRACSVLDWQLPPDIWIGGYARVDPEFHPRFHALSRTYRYYFIEPELDADAMGLAARAFEGSHDFSRFARTSGKDPVRNIVSAGVFYDEDFIVFEVCAESFLWHMVRYMASALSGVGTGQSPPESIGERLSGTRCPALSPAPPEGLILWDIEYGIPFNSLARGQRSGRHLESERQHHRLMSHICEVLR
ncbi:MAG: tRNA pseudouridine(38-40) synthase TruA [Methanolinea sp.]|nr:tRNA pseudouridine(38-40) synthase TruA [Methanolinea sp.]